MPYLARMSFNSNGWLIPSGFAGKSEAAGAHESEFGFGFEEWFFNKRRFVGFDGKDDHHFAYLDPLRHFGSDDKQDDSLILYTIKHTDSGTQRFVVAELKAGEWRFIDNEEYLQLKMLNSKLVAEMREELCQKMLDLRPRIILNRFDQQVNCLDKNNNEDGRYRLWNIEILNKDLQPFLEEITLETVCPRWHINNLQMFKLWHTDTLTHEKCHKLI